jgi:hypothetical protein
MPNEQEIHAGNGHGIGPFIPDDSSGFGQGVEDRNADNFQLFAISLGRLASQGRIPEGRKDVISDSIAVLIREAFAKPAKKPRRARSTRKRDLKTALQAAKAAGLSVREIAPDGRVVLGDPAPVSGTTGMAKDAADVVADRLRLVHGSR